MLKKLLKVISFLFVFMLVLNINGHKVYAVTKALKYNGCIETIKNNSTITSDSIAVKGWCIYGKAINKMEILVDGKVKGQAAQYYRKDIAKSFNKYNTSKSGFSYTLDITSIGSGTHKIQMKATGADKTTYYITRTVKIKNNTLPFKGYIETPKNNAKYASGKVQIKGWCIYGKAINKIEVLVDGKTKGQASLYSRNDIKKAYRKYNTAKAGFTYNLDITTLTKGTHKIQVKAVSANNTYWMTRTINKTTVTGLTLSQIKSQAANFGFPYNTDGAHTYLSTTKCGGFVINGNKLELSLAEENSVFHNQVRDLIMAIFPYEGGKVMNVLENSNRGQSFYSDGKRVVTSVDSEGVTVYIYF